MARFTLLIFMASVACGAEQGAASPSSECPRGVIHSQTEADIAVDMANRLCGSGGGDAKTTMFVSAMMCTAFGDLAEMGRCGYPRDRASARQFYERACAQKYEPACKALSRLEAS